MRKWRNTLRGYRTIIVNVAGIVIAAAEAARLVDFVPDNYMIWYGLFMMAMNILLRIDTRTPVGER